MSKSRKSPRKRPVNTPRQEVKKPEQTTLLTRRNVLIGLGLSGAAALAWRAGLFNLFKNEEKKSETSEQTDGLSEYEKWASKITLPEVAFLDEEGKLPDTGISEENLNKFSAKYEELLKQLQSDFEAENSDEARFRLSSAFLGSLIQAYRIAIGSSETGGNFDIGSKEFNEIILHANRFLVHKGYYIDIGGMRIKEGNTHEDIKTRISIFKVQAINKLQISDPDGNDFIPIVQLTDQKDFSNEAGNNPTNFFALNGVYNQMAGIILQHKAGTSAETMHNIQTFEERSAKAGSPFKFENTGRLQEDSLALTRSHEGFHYWLHKKGFEPGPKKEVRNKGWIDMDGYRISPQKYVGLYNTGIHELGAVGYGLMNGGESSRIFMSAILTGAPITYDFAKGILIRELYKIAPEKYKGNLLTPMPDDTEIVNVDFFTAVIGDTSLEAIHKIGERMAKLGIYLTQN